MSGNSTDTVKERWMLLAALGCGIAHYYLFFGNEWGVSYPIFVLLFYSYLFWALRERQVLAFSWPNALLIPVLLLSLTYVLFTNLLLAVLNALAVPLLIVCHATWLVHADTLRKRTSSAAVLVMEQLFIHTMQYIPRPTVVLVQSVAGKLKAGRSRELLKVLIGLLLSVPLLIIVVTLLASADSMFDRTMSKLPQLLEEAEVATGVLRLLWIGVIASGLFAFIWGLLHPKPPQHQPKQEEGAVQWEPPALPAAPLPRMDATVAITMLVMLNSVYLLFAVVQFSYFFGGGTADLPDGTTYAAYARRGFAELVVVTLINLTVMMGSLYGVKRPGAGGWAVLRVLLAVMVGFSGIMLSSAYLRLSMYEEAYGYTMTRILVHAIMLFLIVLFVLALVKLWRQETPLLRCYCIAGVVAYVIVNYANVDVMIARNNMDRYEATGNVDTRYLASLSYEVVPHLLAWKQKHPDMPGIDEALQDMRSRLTPTGESAWMEFNWSERRAAKALKESE
ncbi:DUF4153 domain-containing protein [Paenibacillus allorhizosphaerae]|uniref:DUF4173 domain-containing protein n=1 Tax=Paenibacillus allorhizosphaerae TaxID=2849866 RepID=A0ABM8VPW4_9BACL|nr:DUF4173 domain-containing protein [Paenibacillus allorhizosphaerae]CAG7653472.1 hypothetical protein PAECIP111802_05492 [Paenibacillus allorhizosphaerae]